MKINRIYFEKSIKGIYEAWRPIIPCILYWHENIGILHLFIFKFCFWRWWYKINISVFIYEKINSHS